MSNDMDTNIKLLYPVDKNSFFTIDDVGLGKEFDVIAYVEAGEDLNEVINRHEVRVGIVNLTQSKAVGTPQTLDQNVTPEAIYLAARRARVAIPATWANDAEVGDVLQAVGVLQGESGDEDSTSTDRASPSWCPEARQFRGGPPGPAPRCRAEVISMSGHWDADIRQSAGPRGWGRLRPDRRRRRRGSLRRRRDRERR